MFEENKSRIVRVRLMRQQVKDKLMTRYQKYKDLTVSKQPATSKQWTTFIKWRQRKAASRARLTSDVQKWWLRNRHAHKRSSRLSSLFDWQTVRIDEYNEIGWFDPATGRPQVAHDPTGRYVNPWSAHSSSGVHSLQRILRWRWERLVQSWVRYGWGMFVPSWMTRPAIEDVKADPAIKAAVYELESLVEDAWRVTWIGHSTCLLQLQSSSNDDSSGNISAAKANERSADSKIILDDNAGDSAASRKGTEDGAISDQVSLNALRSKNTAAPLVTLLTDPMFATRASPYQNAPVGVARDVPPALSIADLPEKIDFCIISHDHYDHLDTMSVQQLQNNVQHWIVPLGIKSWMMERTDVDPDRIHEMTWWESMCMEYVEKEDGKSNDTSNTADYHWKETERHTPSPRHPLHPTLTKPATATRWWFTCLPAQHWAGRTVWDRNYRLWASFAVWGGQKQSSLYHVGDTALPSQFPLFEQIADYVSHPYIDLALMPIGAYHPDFLMQEAHIHPTQAVKVHETLRVKESLGVHWGTFCLSEEPMDEPPRLLEKAIEEAGVDAETFRTVSIGSTIDIVPHRTQIEILDASASNESVVQGELHESDEGAGDRRASAM
jgi:N-acyl-phosphatidylethanolamine-hydrolysing phospholipase D